MSTLVKMARLTMALGLVSLCAVAADPSAGAAGSATQPQPAQAATPAVKASAVTAPASAPTPAPSSKATTVPQASAVSPEPSSKATTVPQASGTTPEPLPKAATVPQSSVPAAAPVVKASEPTPAPPESGTTPSANPSETPPAGTNNLRFNFNDAPLDKVLDYLSEAAGFIVIKEAKVDARIDVVSHQPLNKDEAIALLNTVLNDKGYAAVRQGRTLTIVKRADAKTMDIPVMTGSSPASIPKTGMIVTQIIPVKHADATELLDNLQPLLGPDAVANANKSSNAIVLTDTQANVHRMAEIIQALDTSISSISEVRVFPLTYSKATDTASLINSLFQVPSGGTGGFRGRNPVARFFQRMRGRLSQQNQSEGAARQAGTRVQAVADERTNSVAVAAPTELMPVIADVIKQIDQTSPPATEVRVFHLNNAYADDVATELTTVFGQTGPQARRNFRRRGRRGRGPEQSSEETVQVAADHRTNSVIVTASNIMMAIVEDVIKKIDQTSPPTTEVRVFPLKNAYCDEVADEISEAYGQGSTTGGPQQRGRYFRRRNVRRGQQAEQASEEPIEVVSDYRTNSVIVTADSVTMEQIADTIQKLDANPARKQKVFVYKLENANVENVAAILQGMFPQQVTTSATRPKQDTAPPTLTVPTTSQAGVSSGGRGNTRGLGGL